MTGFTRPDVITLTGAIFLLCVLIWLGMIASGERRRTWACAHQMRILGRAFTEHAKDHDDALPAAVLEDGQTDTTWDREIAVYIASKHSNGKTPISELQTPKIASYFHCPSDKEPRGGAQPRSYSMPMYDLNKVDWPPDENCEGGLGLYLDAARLAKVRKSLSGANSLSPTGGEGQGEEAAERATAFIPAIKLSMVPAPADTALLVERINILNSFGNKSLACTVSSGEQFQAKTMEQNKFHGGRMNYLLLDGHVETFSPLAASPFPSQEPDGVWTIKAGD